MFHNLQKYLPTCEAHKTKFEFEFESDPIKSKVSKTFPAKTNLSFFSSPSCRAES